MDIALFSPSSLFAEDDDSSAGTLFLFHLYCKAYYSAHNLQQIEN